MKHEVRKENKEKRWSSKVICDQPQKTWLISLSPAKTLGASFK